MIPYFYTAKFSAKLALHVLENGDLFDEAMHNSITAFNGRVLKCFLAAGVTEPIGFVEFPSECDARSWNVFYNSQDGVSNSKIIRLLSKDDMASMAKKIKSSLENSNNHRFEL